MMKTRLIRFLWFILILSVIGCQESDPRVVQVAMESTQRQAEQNRQMGELQKHIAEGAKQLVDADSQARQQLVELQREMRTDQADIGRQRDALESDRRQIAKERYWDSILGTTISTSAGILACLLPLLVCCWLLYATRDKQGTDEALAELLVEELTADRPMLLSSHPLVPLIENSASKRNGTASGDISTDTPTTT